MIGEKHGSTSFRKKLKLSRISFETAGTYRVVAKGKYCQFEKNVEVRVISKYSTPSKPRLNLRYLTIIPRTRMGSESVAHEAEGRMRGHEGERNNCFSKIQLVAQKYRDKTTLASKTRFSRYCFGFQSWRFSLLVGYNI